MHVAALEAPMLTFCFLAQRALPMQWAGVGCMLRGQMRGPGGERKAGSMNYEANRH